MPHYKLTYFGIRGLAEPIRCCLHYADIEFDDVRVKLEEWPAMKPTTSHGVLPLFEEDGELLTQSGAILRYVSKIAALNGKTEWEEAKADETYHFFHDNIVAGNAYVHDKSNIKKADDINKAYEIFVPVATKALDYYQNMLNKANNGYILASGLTYADLVVYSHLLTLRNCDAELVDKYPKLLEFIERIEGLPQLQKYFKSRPFSVN
ncbi:unnamed protein product [Bursaphelenchus okinawaensis]|uniref:Glutathione transferase n=1 Tax=Bursaphelenchus okinawaensis TaxID=465554 RepID=A0A811JZR0_9BILA|nr:unnamed protein product [Bursaphelenchus okinawaensis]CAG9088451.1 unnamed protein product [Bursaphelenchus okinawaensis]